MNQRFYLLLLGGIFLNSCSKDKETQPALAGSFQSEPIISATDIRMYTSTGQVDNRALVDKFLARRQNLTGYFSRVDVPIPATNSLTLAFRGTNRVTLLSKGATSADSILTEITSQSPQRLVLAPLDSVNILRNGPQNRAEQLSNLVQAEQPGQRCYHVPSASGTYAQSCRVRPIRVITRHDGKLFLPQLSWLIQSAGAYGSSYWAYSGVQNTFNTSVISQLAVGDTLVVQAREIPFSKK
jgi:hypothetical protein